MFDILEYGSEKTIYDYKILKKKALLENFDKNNFFNKTYKVNHNLFIIYSGNNPIGFIGYKQKKIEKLSHNFLILNFYVSKKNQGKGVGGIIYDYMENKILECDKNILRLYCKITEINNESIGFFEKKGFKRAGKKNL